MDYKKIFNEANLEKQKESKMRLNECGGYGGCGGAASSYYYAEYVTFAPATIFKWLDAEPEFANVDRNYMKDWCRRNNVSERGKAGRARFINEFRAALQAKEEKERKRAEKQSQVRDIIDNFEVTREQIKAAKSAKCMDNEVRTNKEAAEASKRRYEDSLERQNALWKQAGGKELWDEILANGYTLN